MSKTVELSSVDAFNKLCGIETLHPLVSVVDLNKATRAMGKAIYNYGIYALFIKLEKSCYIQYGRQPYDYQEGTIVCFAPGQTAEVTNVSEKIQHNNYGLLFHPDLLRGTALGRTIQRYTFFSYEVNEALHISEEERTIILDSLRIIQMELEHGIDKHSKGLIITHIELLLGYCMRFYDRQFITRAKANHDILERFDRLMDAYFEDNKAEEKGLPSVKYFADKLCLSANYFGDLFKKETGKSPQEYIQERVIELAKERISTTTESMSQIAYSLGFQYPQHLSRMFKKRVGCTPNEYRNQTAD